MVEAVSRVHCVPRIPPVSLFLQARGEKAVMFMSLQPIEWGFISHRSPAINRDKSRYCHYCNALCDLEELKRKSTNVIYLEKSIHHEVTF